MKSITSESLTLVTLLLSAIDRVPTQAIFDNDPYESRRTALPGSRLLKVLVFFQLCAPTSACGLCDLVAESRMAQKALGGTLARKTLSKALPERDLEQMIEVWLLLLQHYGAYLPRLGRKFARLAPVDASLIKLSLEAFDWATYREQTGAAKMTCVLDWARGIPHQFVFTASGKVHDLKAAAALRFCAGWTYIFDRGYFGFDFLTFVVSAGAHFVVRLKRGVPYEIVHRAPLPTTKLPAGLKALSGDYTVTLPGWDRAALLRLVVYQLTSGKVISVLTTRHDLCALSVVRLYKERWTIENWWRWIKRLYVIKAPLGQSENALPLQIVAAFVTDLLCRVFKHAGGFKGTLYEFIRTGRGLALAPLNQLGVNLNSTLSAVAKLPGLIQPVAEGVP